MLKQTPRLLRCSIPAIRATHPRRLYSTAPPHQRSRSWKSSAVRWGLAIGGIYYYSSSDILAEEPEVILPSEENPIQTLESIATERQARKAKEQEASRQSAFNEETGEINWDCPCLGGMAHGPCGEEFRAAFSCFVFSEADPKGMDCIDNFKNMQDCLRKYPDVYGVEPEDDEETPDDENPLSNPHIDESSTPPLIDPSLPKPEVDEQSVPLSPPKLHSSSPQVDEPSVARAIPPSGLHPISESPLSRTGSENPGPETGRSPEQPNDSGATLVPKAKHDVTTPEGGK